MFKELKIILPVLDNYKGDLSHVHNALQELLLCKFKGYTQMKAVGAYHSDSMKVTEEVMVYTVAGNGGQEDNRMLCQIALAMKEEAKQECIYVTLNTGEVLFV